MLCRGDNLFLERGNTAYTHMYKDSSFWIINYKTFTNLVPAPLQSLHLMRKADSCCLDLQYFQSLADIDQSDSRPPHYSAAYLIRYVQNTVK